MRRRILELELSSSQVQGAICLLDPDNSKLSLSSTAAAISLAVVVVKVCMCSRSGGTQLFLVSLGLSGQGRCLFLSAKKKKFKCTHRYVPHSWKSESVERNREGLGSGSEAGGSGFGTAKQGYQTPTPYNLSACKTGFEMEGFRGRRKRRD